jgi:outer membrane protein TolC
MKIKILFIFLLGSITTSFAQDSVALSFDQFNLLVATNHPVSKQAFLLPEMAKSQLKIARGSFDPSIQFDIDQKQTKGINTYKYIEPELKIPTLIGLDFKTGIEQSSGTSVNPEIGKFDPNTGKTSDVNYGLFYAGFQLPVLRGLLTDQRRIELRQAKLMIDFNQAEQVKIVNKLFLNAAKDYWNWFAAYQKFNYIKSGLDLAQNRLNFIKSRIKEGEEKPIDSVEAFTELKRREVQFLEANLELMNSRTIVSAYLWDENANPLQLLPSSKPMALGTNLVKYNQDTLLRLIDFASNNHPEMRKFSLKINQLELDRKLAIENLKPQLNFSYLPFQTYTNGNKEEVEGLFAKNYKFGMSFKSSLFLRKERGKFQLSTLKIKETNLAFQQGKRELSNGVLIAFNELENIEKLRAIQQALVENASLLRDAEITRFDAGESSLFLVNQRERTLIEAQSKLAELIAKYAFAKTNLYFAAGIIN